MKSTMSLAVLFLTQNVSAAEVSKHHHHKTHYQNMAQSGTVLKNKLRESIRRNNMYPDTKADREWYELDDPTERIHDSEAADDESPHDPDVVDAPEDMKRSGPLGNDHEELHNAKLSPDGYYNGFHHKDYEGKFV